MCKLKEDLEKTVQENVILSNNLEALKVDKFVKK